MQCPICHHRVIPDNLEQLYYCHDCQLHIAADYYCPVPVTIDKDCLNNAQLSRYIDIISNQDYVTDSDNYYIITGKHGT